MQGYEIYILGTIIVAAVFLTIVKKVINELDEQGSFASSKKPKTKEISQEQLLEHIDNENQKCQRLCDELLVIFDSFINKMNDENNKSKANALKSVLTSIKSLASDELKDRLLKLMPEFEELINQDLGQKLADEFSMICSKTYNEIFKD